MKKLEIIIRPERLDDLKTILNSNGAHGLMISNIMGYGNQHGHKQVYNSVVFFFFLFIFFFKILIFSKKKKKKKKTKKLISVVIFFQRLRSNQLYQMRLTRQLLIR